MQRKISVVITDLDNTLYDWVEIWYQSFNAMLQKLVSISGISQNVLESEIRSVFQKHGTSEYTYLLEEVPSLSHYCSNEPLRIRFQSAIKAYKNARSKTLKLYPTVLETLRFLKAQGCLVIGCTESKSLYSAQRVKTLKLDGLIDCIYSAPDHTLSNGKHTVALIPLAKKYVHLNNTQQRYFPEGKFKPNPQILFAVIEQMRIDVSKAIYIGDNLMKDVAMAQDAQLLDVYASYGKAQHREAYELLRRVSHWTDKDVEREKTIYQNRAIEPSFVLHSSFSELLNLFDFVAATPID